MNKKYFWGVAYAAALLLSASCASGSGSQEDNDHDHEHGEHAEGSDEIVMTPEKAKAAGVEVAEVHPQNFRMVIPATGQVLASQADETTVVANVAGMVSFGGSLTEGMSVGRGATLLSISTAHTAEGDPGQRARIAYEAAKQEYERASRLAVNKIVSERELAQAKQNYENAKLTYNALAGQSRGGGRQAMTAPIAGFVKNCYVKEGDYVNVGQPLVSISQNKKLFLRAEVSEKYYGQLNRIQSANFKTPYDNKVYALDELGGRVLSYGKATDADAFFIPVTFEFDNKGEVVPGSLVEVYLLSDEMAGQWVLPKSAITEEQGLFFIYLQLDEEGYKKQEVTVGVDNGNEVQILSGLKEGDRVVTKGAYQVKLASASNAIPAHNHEH
jgi:RND family efflux transporter MFP subunit